MSQFCNCGPMNGEVHAGNHFCCCHYTVPIRVRGQMPSWSVDEGWKRVIPRPDCPRSGDLNLQPSDTTSESMSF